MKSTLRVLVTLLLFAVFSTTSWSQKSKIDDDAPSVEAKEEKTNEKEKEEVEAAKEPVPFGIGSAAPALDIEHWVSDGDGHFKEVTKFEKDNVYIVEFWATWCGPCISAMPHIAELQETYADKGVQVISISDEQLETVEKFLERTVRGEKDKTYGELTSVYCLTTDPDGSTKKDYMEAAKQNGIPTAFVVGKTGLIEWIGHPMSIDKPLEDIVAGNWDLDKAKEEFEAKAKVQALMMSLSRYMRAGKTKEAIAALDETIEGAKSRTILKQLNSIKFQVLANNSELAKEAAEFAISILGDDDYSADEANNLTWGVYMMAKQGRFNDENVTKAALELAQGSVENAGKQKAYILDTVAHLHHLLGDAESALEAQKQAFEAAEAGDKPMIKKFLNELQAELEEDEDDDDDEEDEDEKEEDNDE